MKKLLVVLLSLGLIVSFSSGALATTNITMLGTFDMAAGYDNNGDLTDSGYSRALTWTRTRLMPRFNIAEGLTFTMRLDALEKAWGSTAWKQAAINDPALDVPAKRVAPGQTVDETSSRSTQSKVGVKIQEDVEFERAFVTFSTKIGQFIIGYQDAAAWGTKWADYGITRPRLRYQVPFGPVTLLAIWEKQIEGDATTNKGVQLAYAPGGVVDADQDAYYLAGIYKKGSLEAGLLYGYTVGKTTRITTAAFSTKIHTLQPYVKATFGPIYFESEIDYQFGKTAEFDNPAPGQNDITKDGWAAYAKVQYNMGPAYVGGGVGYLSGDNDMTPNKDKDKTSGVNGKDWSPALIMGSNDDPDIFYAHAANDDPGGIGMGYGSKKEGTTTYNLFAGYKVTPKLDVTLALTLAKTNVKFKNGMYLGSVTNKFVPTTAASYGKEYVSDDIGKEVDVTATYKIFDNLSYMVGAGYMWTGDFFKGTDPNKKIGDDYQILHRLQLAF